MKPLAAVLTALLGLAPLGAWADPPPHARTHGHAHAHGHGHGPGHGRGGHHKEEFWVGHCKVERSYKRNGDYKEERKCHGPATHGHAPAVVVLPPPVVLEPGIVIQGTVRIP